MNSSGSFFKKNGICHFGRSCKFTHPEEFVREGVGGTGINDGLPASGKKFILNPEAYYGKRGDLCFF